MAGVKDVAIAAGIKEDDVKKVVKAIATLAWIGNVSVRGFGTFKTKTRAARTGRNPQTGAALQIPAKDVLTFKAA
jgi:nucleoid DNA-binding protein